MLFSRKQEISLPLSLLLSPSLPSSILSLRFSSLSTRIAIGARGHIHPTPEFTHLQYPERIKPKFVSPPQHRANS